MSRLPLLGVSFPVPSTLLVGTLLAATAGIGAMLLAPSHTSGSQSPCRLKRTSKAQASAILQGQAGCFVPNQGQWDCRARFLHRSGPMTLFLEDRGWVIDLVERQAKAKAMPHGSGPLAIHQGLPCGIPADQKIHGVALRMTFEGDTHLPQILGEQKRSGHHNYFLGSDESRWRTGVPLYASVRYENLYTGIDLRLRELDGVPEYDLFLQPGADLRAVTVHVEGAKCLSIARDGSLVIETALGPVIQPGPKTWQVDGDGKKRKLACNFTLLDADRFGFSAPAWDGDTSLTIDPGLIWSTFLGGSARDDPTAISVDARGVVTVTGYTESPNFPTTSGAYSTTSNRGTFVTRLDPSKTGKAQLVYSTLLGGKWSEEVTALSVDVRGVITVGGYTSSPGFPTTSGAYNTKNNGGSFVSRLDPSKTGSAQLVYSTFFASGYVMAISADASGVVTVAGRAGSTTSSFPTTSGAYDTTYNGGRDGFVSRLDPSKSGSAQLVYSTFLGGSSVEELRRLSVDARGVVTVAGWTISSDFPTTNGAYDTTHTGFSNGFISRLDPSKSGSAQLVYSTFLGAGNCRVTGLFVDPNGRVTVAGVASNKFPTTSGAYNTTEGGVFASRLDPSKSGSAQLVYSTFLGTFAWWETFLSVHDGRAATVAGTTNSTNFPTTSGAYDTTHNGGVDLFVSRLSMVAPLSGDVHEISISAGGTQKLSVNAGKAHANRSYWIFGSVTGTTPGVTLGSAIGAVHIPLNPDVWTDYTIALANTTTLTNTKATLDASGTAQASFNIPKANVPSAIGLIFRHAYLVYDPSNNFYLASNPVPLKLVK